MREDQEGTRAEATAEAQRDRLARGPGVAVGRERQGGFKPPREMAVGPLHWESPHFPKLVASWLQHCGR